MCPKARKKKRKKKDKKKKKKKKKHRHGETALPYLDVPAPRSRMHHRASPAYQVSGDFAIVAAAAANGWLDGFA